MTITEGYYRGVKINWTLANGTDGQMWLTLQPNNLFLKAHLKEIPEAEIRKCFSLPTKDGDSFSLHVRPENENEINWCYMWSGIQGISTKYEYLAYLFKGIDALWKYVHEKIPFPQPQIKYEVVDDFKFKDLLTKIQNEVFSKVNASKWPYEYQGYDIEKIIVDTCGKEMCRCVDVKYSQMEDGTSTYTVLMSNDPIIPDGQPCYVPVDPEAPKAPKAEVTAPDPEPPPAPKAIPPAIEK